MEVKLLKKELKTIIQAMLALEVGASAKSIIEIVLGLDVLDYRHAPSDIYDFEKCVNIIKKIPKLRYGVYLLGKKDPVWKELNEHWDEFATRYFNGENTYYCSLGDEIRAIARKGNGTCSLFSN